MKSLYHLLLAGALLTSSACISPINFISKIDPRFSQSLRTVYLTSEPANAHEETTYLRVMAGLRKELRARGVDVMIEVPDVPAGTVLTLRQGASFRREHIGPGLSGHGLGLDGGVGTAHDEFLVVLTDGATARDFWFGQIGYQENHVPYLAKKIVDAMVNDGLVAR